MQEWDIERVTNIVLVLFVFQVGIILGLSVSYLQTESQSGGAGQPSVISNTTDDPGPNTTTRGIPGFVTDQEIEESRHSIQFRRNGEGTELFDRHLHDAVLVRGEEDTLYLIATEEKTGNQVLYTTNTSALTEWELVDDHYLATQGAVDDIARVENEYIAYGNNGIYTTDDLRADNWTLAGPEPATTNDLGAYHDGERVHIYYETETENVTGPSGKEIGHATSPGGVTNWTHYPSVFRAPGEYAVGDFEVIEGNDTVVLLGDYSRTHPRYEVRLWANDNFYTNFTMLDEPAVRPRNRNTTHTDDFGVQDGTVVELEDGTYFMVANGHDSADADVRLQYYIGS